MSQLCDENNMGHNPSRRASVHSIQDSSPLKWVWNNSLSLYWCSAKSFILIHHGYLAKRKLESLQPFYQHHAYISTDICQKLIRQKTKFKKYWLYHTSICSPSHQWCEGEVVSLIQRASCGLASFPDTLDNLSQFGRLKLSGWCFLFHENFTGENRETLS